MKKLSILALLLPAIAYAGDNTVTVRFIMPTQYIDSTSLAAADIKETLIEWKIRGTTNTAGSLRVPAPAIVSSEINLGKVCAATIYDFAASTILQNGARSDTVVVPYTVDVFTAGGCKPNPPNAVTAQ